MAARSDDEAFARLIAEAARFAEQASWREAARRWTTAAGMAHEGGALPTAAELYGTAGEAFRRADAPDDANNALQLALALGDTRPTTRTALSAVLAARGRMEGALEHARQAGTGPMAVDAQLAVLLATGTRTELRAVLEGLPEGHARRFRTAQILRLEGELNAAHGLLVALEAELDNPAGRGGIRVERAEIDALQGRGAEAAAVFEQAAHDHRQAGRTGLVWACTAAHLRTLLDAGISPLGGDLREGIRWADHHEQEVLALDLRTCAGRFAADARELGQLRDRALSFGLIRRAGRAELARAELLEGAERIVAAQDASRLLADDLPLCWRARTLHAEAVAEMSAAAGARLAADLVIPVGRAGMEPERERLAALEA